MTRWCRARRAISLWRRQGRPVPPPPAFKQSVVRDYGRRFRVGTLIETGTYLGEMVAAVRQDFSRIISIELDVALFERAKKEFAGLSHITLLHGDSGRLLVGVAASVETPALFWLDAHHSGGITARGAQETPILQELAVIFGRGNCGDVILIDDVHCFDGNNDYPTLAALEAHVTGLRPGVVYEVTDNIIRIHRGRDEARRAQS